MRKEDSTPESMSRSTIARAWPPLVLRSFLASSRPAKIGLPRLPSVTQVEPLQSRPFAQLLRTATPISKGTSFATGGGLSVSGERKRAKTLAFRTNETTSSRIFSTASNISSRFNKCKARRRGSSILLSIASPGC
eukprot:scaffold923_cov256-Pinguiococcus_pyrenoidosus.AAC.25